MGDLLTAGKMRTCNICGKNFASSSSLSQHKRVHGDKRFTCVHCGKGYLRRDRYLQHLRTHSNPQQAGCADEALNGSAQRVSFTPVGIHADPMAFMAAKRQEITALLEQELKKRKGLKFFICLKVLIVYHTTANFMYITQNIRLC